MNLKHEKNLQNANDAVIFLIVRVRILIDVGMSLDDE